MAWQVNTWVVQNSRHKGAELLCELMISNHAHADGTGAYPSIQTLAEECRMSTRQIQRITRRLADSGEIAIIERTGRGNAHEFIFRMNRTDAEFEAVIAYRRAVLNGDNLTPFSAKRVTSPARKGDKSDPERVTSGTGKGDKSGAKGDTAMSPETRNVRWKGPVEPFLETAAAADTEAGTCTDPPAAAAAEHTPRDEPEKPPATGDLVARLHAAGLNRDVAAELAARDPDECEAQLRYLPFVVFGENGFRGGRGKYLRLAVEKGFAPPDRYAAEQRKQAERQRAAERAAQRSAAPEAAKPAAERLAADAEFEGRRLALSRHDPHTWQRIQAETIEKLPPPIRSTIERARADGKEPGPLARAALDRALRAAVLNLPAHQLPTGSRPSPGPTAN